MRAVRTCLQENVFENAIRYSYLNTFRDKINSWYDAGEECVIIELVDGSRMYYDDLTRTYRHLERNNELITEQDFRDESARRISRTLWIRGMTQRELANKTGISEHSICNYITGKSTPSIFAANKIAKALNCELSEIFYID